LDPAADFESDNGVGHERHRSVRASAWPGCPAVLAATRPCAAARRCSAQRIVVAHQPGIEKR
jgi:hypothetical protein